MILKKPSLYGFFYTMKKVNKNIVKELKVITIKVLKRNEAEIVDMVTEEQMWGKGEDGDGRSLGTPAPLTIELKLNTPGADKKVSVLTGRFSGEMHEQAKFLTTSVSGVRIGSTAPSTKPFEDQFGNQVWKVNDENKTEISQTMLQPAFVSFLKNNFFE